MPFLSPKRVSIWLNKFFAGPVLCLKCWLILCLLKWLSTNMLFFYNCSAMTLVKMDLLYGMKSFPLVFLFILFIYCCFLNLLRISMRVLTLLSDYLLSGMLINVKVLRVLNDALSINLNYMVKISSLSSVSL